MRFVGQSTSEWLTVNPDGTTQEGGEGRIWTAPDVMSSEIETCEFLAGLVRLMKPAVVVETGCHKGKTTVPIAQAIRRNGFGRLYCCDTDKEHVEHVRELFSQWPIDLGDATIHECSGVELIQSLREIDLAFVDSGNDDARFAECCALVGGLSPDGIVVLHDAHRSTYARVRTELGWQAIKVFTPRGLAMFQKPA